jgi:SAM-dependent methyltransferase
MKIKLLLPHFIRRRIGTNITSLGFSYQCPFCNGYFDAPTMIGLDFPVLRERQVVGAGKRLGGCPHCGSYDRERLVYTYLDKYTSIFKDSKSLRLLHVAPEANLSKVLNQISSLEYTCIDKFTEGYRYPDFVKDADITCLPFEDNTFDIIICNHVLEHIIEEGKAISELYRVLKAGGEAILQVPISKNSESTFEDSTVTDPKEREKLFGQFDHVRLYGQDYPQRLAKYGFHVRQENLNNKYPQYALNPDENIFIGTKLFKTKK